MKKYITILLLSITVALSGCAVGDALFTSKVAVYDENGQPVLNEDGTQKYIYEQSDLVTAFVDGTKSVGGIWYWVGSGVAMVAGAYVSYRNGKNKGLIVADTIAAGVDAYRDQLDQVEGGSVAGDKLIQAIDTAASGTSVQAEVKSVIAKTTTPDKTANSTITFEQYIKTN